MRSTIIGELRSPQWNEVINELAFSKDTVLLAEDGCNMINITDLKEGDKIFGPTGKVLTVANIHKDGVAPLYRINYDDSWYRVTEDHVLNLMCGMARLKNPITDAEMYLGQTFNISVEDYLRQDSEFQQNVYGYHSTLSFQYSNPGFPPYEYGVILSHKHFMEALMKKMEQTDLKIPHSYMCNSAEVRELLLAGYIDGCGGLCEEGRLKLHVEDDSLRSDFMFLIKSLGLTTYCTDNAVLEVLGKLGNVPTEIIKMSDDDTQPYYPIYIEPDSKGKTVELDVKENGEKLVMLGDFSVVHV